MKGFRNIIAYYFNQSLFLRVLFVLGIVLLIPVSILLLSMSPENRDKVAFPFLLLPFWVSIGITYLVAPSAARRLLACRNTSLVPGFHLTIGLSLLVFTLVMVSVPVLLSLVLTVGSPVLLAVVLFVTASLYCVVVQVFLTLPVKPQLLSYLSLAIVLFMIRYGEPIWLWSIAGSGIFIMPLLCCTGWCLALLRLYRNHQFPLNRQTAATFRQDLWSSPPSWPLDEGRGKVATATGTLLLGHPDGLANRLLRMLGLIVVVPLINLFILYNVGMFEDGTEGMFAKFAIIMMIVITFIISQQSPEIVARARWLWLRCDGDRQSLWRMVENRLLREQMLAYALMFIIIMTLLLLTGTALIHIISFCSMLVAGFFLTYCGVFCRISELKTVAFVAFLIGGPAFVITTVIGLFSDNYFPALVTQLVLATLALIFHILARRRFLSIDWLCVKPARQPRQNSGIDTQRASLA